MTKLGQKYKQGYDHDKKGHGNAVKDNIFVTLISKIVRQFKIRFIIPATRIAQLEIANYLAPTQIMTVKCNSAFEIAYFNILFLIYSILTTLGNTHSIHEPPATVLKRVVMMLKSFNLAISKTCHKSTSRTHQKVVS